MKLDGGGGFEDEMLRAAMRNLHLAAKSPAKYVFTCKAICRLLAKGIQKIAIIAFILLISIPMGFLGPVLGVFQLTVFLAHCMHTTPKSAIQYLRINRHLFGFKMIFPLIFSLALISLPLLGENVIEFGNTSLSTVNFLGPVVVVLMCLIHHQYNKVGLVSIIHEVHSPYYLKPTMKFKFQQNWMAVISILTVFFQYFTFVLSPETLGLSSSANSPVIMIPSFSLPPSLFTARNLFYVEWCFALLVIMSWFGLCAILTYLYNADKTAVLERFPFARNVVGLFADTMYFAVLSKILRPFTCSAAGNTFYYPDSNLSLIDDTFELECFKTEHNSLASISMISTIFFCLSVTLVTPFFLEDFTGSNHTCI